MAKPILDDALWELIEPQLPKPKNRQRRYPGRKPIPHRAALTGILYVLRTGIPWEYLPQEMGCGSGMTCWRRLRDWQEAGVWERIRRTLLGELRAADQIDWSCAVADSASLRALKGGAHGPQSHGPCSAWLETPPSHRCARPPAGVFAHRGEPSRRDPVATVGGSDPADCREAGVIGDTGRTACRATARTIPSLIGGNCAGGGSPRCWRAAIPTMAVG